MRIKQYHGDIWDLHAAGWYVADPTNLYVKANGANVMGRGISRQVLERWPGIDLWYGRQLMEQVRPEVAAAGMVSFADVASQPVVINDQHRIAFVPVKTHWRLKADRKLMRASLSHLAALLIAHSEMKIALPRLGCGNGGDKWEGDEGVKEQLFRPFLNDLPERARERVAIVHPPAGISD